MNRSDFFKTLIGGAAVAAVAKMPVGSEPNMIKGFIPFNEGEDRIAPGAFKNIPDCRDLSCFGHSDPIAIHHIKEIPLMEATVTYSCDIIVE